MRTNLRSGSKKLLLILIVLIAGLSASAITFGESILPFGLVQEGSFFANLDSDVRVASKAKPFKVGTMPGITSPSMFAPQTGVDDLGADDEPGQKDLNALSVDYADQGDGFLDVTWNWDSTSTTGNNTRDACSLFDTDGDGNANFSFCVVVKTNGSVTNVLYSCGDESPFKCTQPAEPIEDPATVGTAGVVVDSDPFGVPGSPDFDAAHVSGNTCATNPACYRNDTVAVVRVDLNDFGNPAGAILLNVCSYPSGEPNSDPSDCVFEAPPGSLTLIKEVDNLGETGTGYLSAADFPLSIDGTGTTSGAPVSVPAGTYSIAEESDPGYSVGTWTCNNVATGTPGSTTASISVAAGEEVTCIIENTLIAAPDIDLQKVGTLDMTVVAPSNQVNAGDKINYAFTVTNTGNVTLTNVTITDPLITVSGGPIASLAPGASDNTTFTGSYTLTQNDVDAGTFTNTATACGTPPVGTAECDEDDDTQTLTPSLALDLQKVGTLDMTVVAPSNQVNAGDTISYAFTVTNNSNVTLTNVTLADTVGGVTISGGPIASMAPGAVDSTTFTGSYTLTQGDIDAGTFTNTATACGTAPAGGQVCDPDDDTQNFTPVPSLVVDKVDDNETFDSVGDVINYTITVTNNGNVTLNNVAVTDPNADGLDCDPNTAGAQTSGFTIAPGAFITCTASHTIVQADLDAGSYFNEACADDGAGGAAADCDDVTTGGDPKPDVTVSKTGNGPINAGQTAIFTILVSSVGNATANGVTLSDSLPAGIAWTEDSADCTISGTVLSCSFGNLAPGATRTVNVSGVTDLGDCGPLNNLATVAATNEAPNTGGNNTSSASIFVACPSLTLEKTSTTTVIDTLGQVVPYTYVITNTGNITLTNVTLIDDKVIAANISCTPSQPATLAPGDTMECSGTYTVTQADIDAEVPVVNIATADSDQTNPGVDDTVSIPINVPDDGGNTYPTGKEPCEFANDPEGNASEPPLTLVYKRDRFGKIKSVSPANFFFYGYLTASSSGQQTVTVEQSNNSGLPNMLAVAATVYLANNCNMQVGNPRSLNTTASSFTFNFDGVEGVEYLIKVQFKPSPLVGQSFGTGGALYQFSMSLDGSSDSDVGGTPLVFSN